MSKLHIKKDDTVIVIAGADKGKTGKVLKVLVDENRAIVEGVHIGLLCGYQGVTFYREERNTEKTSFSTERKMEGRLEDIR